MCGLFLVPKLQQFLFPLSPAWLLNGSAFDADLLLWPKVMGCGYGTCLLSVLQAVCFLSLSHSFTLLFYFTHSFSYLKKKKYIWAQTRDFSVCGAYYDTSMPEIDVAEVLCALYSLKKVKLDSEFDQEALPGNLNVKLSGRKSKTLYV